MFGNSLNRRLVVAFASLLMSSIAVSAAISPSPISADSNVEVLTYA